MDLSGERFDVDCDANFGVTFASSCSTIKFATSVRGFDAISANVDRLACSDGQGKCAAVSTDLADVSASVPSLTTTGSGFFSTKCPGIVYYDTDGSTP